MSVKDKVYVKKINELFLEFTEDKQEFLKTLWQKDNIDEITRMHDMLTLMKELKADCLKSRITRDNNWVIEFENTYWPNHWAEEIAEPDPDKLWAIRGCCSWCRKKLPEKTNRTLYCSDECSLTAKNWKRYIVGKMKKLPPSVNKYTFARREANIKYRKLFGNLPGKEYLRLS